MKKLWNRSLMLLASAIAFAGCSNEAEELVSQGTRALDVQVKVQPTSRTMVKGTALAEGAGLGVNVTATDGGLYDGNDAGYLNILYTATGTGANQEWNSTTPVMLSGTEGKMYAYYPHTPGVDFKAITVDITDQHDWMYGAEAYTVSDKAATAAVVLKHAQTAVNVNVVRDATYTGVGAVSALSVTSEGLASGGTLDTRDGSWSALSGANTAISIISENFTLDGTTKSSQENPYMFIPASAETRDFTVTATVDGKTYNSSVTMKEVFAKGKVYNVSLKMTNVGLTVSEVTLVDWEETTLDEGTFQPEVAPANTWASVANGVYAVSADGNPVEVDNATTSCIGVALITDNQRIMIAKPNATYVYWGYNFYGKDVAGITNISPGSGYIGEDETYGTDFTTWSTGPVVDFNGKANTAAIINAYTEHNVAMNDGDICKVLETFNAGSDNQGHSDWYVPACGQLAIMYLAKTDLDAALTKIGGTAFDSDSYWSSSEFDAYAAWYVSFYDGLVGAYEKDGSRQVRFVRDLD